MAISLTHVTDYLLAQSWQIAILILVIAIINYLLRNKSAHIRYLLWLIVLAKCFVPPFYDVPLAILPVQEQAEPAVISPSVEMALPETQVADTTMPESSVLHSTPPEITPIPVVEGTYTKLTINQWLGIGWLVGACGFLVFNLLRALRANFWLSKYRKLLPAGLRKKIEKSFSASGIKNFPNVWIIEGFSQPFVWGLLRGSIYVPTNFLNINKQEHQKSVLSHELSHVLRFDAAVNILQVISQAIFWFHPLIWWINRKIRQEREKCCDEMAIAQMETLPKDYSTAILETIAARDDSIRPVPSLAVAGHVKNIEERIKTMLRPGKKFYKRPSVIALTIVLMLAVVIVPIGCALTNREEAKIAANQEKRFSSLYEAAKAADLDEVKRLIAEGANLNAFDKEDNMTPLAVAADRGYTEIVEVLLDSGANIDIGDTAGDTPLYFAILSFYEDTARVLIAAGANVNLSRSSDDTPLLEAIWLEQPDIVKALIDAGVNIKLASGDGWLPLQQAVQQCNPDIVKLFINADDNISDLNRAALKGDLSKLNTLFEEGADLNKKDEFGFAPIEYAMAAGQSEAVKFLIEHGVDINLRSSGNMQYSLLHLAAKANLNDVVEILIDRGIPVDIKSMSGSTALYEAAYYGYKGLVELLISKGASLESKDSSDRTPLNRAIINGHTEIVELLIDKGANVNASGYPGTPLYLANVMGFTEIANLLQQHGAKITLTEAITLGDIEQVKNLLSQGIDIDEANSQGRTNLHIAAQEGHKDIAELLIDKGADVNAKTFNNTTVLHYATRYAHKDVTEVLITQGANVNAKINNGSTALHYAVDVARKDIVELLIAGGADLNIKDNSGFTPLYIAQQNGYTEIAELLRNNGAQEIPPTIFGALDYGDLEQIKLLISQGSDVNTKNNSGQTLLHLVSQSGNREIAEFLLESGADINAENNTGQTPLDRAERLYKPEITELLIQHGAERGLRGAIIAGDIEEVKRRISQGININESNLIGQTLLHVACQSGQKEIVELLIISGANVNVTNRRLLTPLDIAEQNGYTEIVELLIQNGAQKGSSTLRVAINSGDIEQVKLLISQVADVTAEILSLAELRGNTEIIELLMSKLETSSIHLEAEDADLIQAPLMIYDDPNASGGQYITVISGNNSSTNPPAPNGTASYAFEVAGGKYRILARVITSHDVDRYSSDSCWIRIIGATVNTTVHTSGWIQWNEIGYGENWHWATVHSSSDGNKQVEFDLDPGTFTLEIGYREDGLFLDSILISKID